MQELSTTKFHGVPSRCARADGIPLKTASVCSGDSLRTILPSLVARAEEPMSPIGTKRRYRDVCLVVCFWGKDGEIGRDLWIVEFGVLRFRLMVKRGPRMRACR